MKIDVLANDGSPLGVTEQTIWGDDVRIGVGGSELAILTLCGLWTDEGHEVCFYNDARHPEGSHFEHRAINSFNAQADRDVLIVFRSPNKRAEGARGLKVWLSHDQFTRGDFREFSNKVDKIVVISPYHAQYFKDRYHIENTIVIDIPVRIWDYEDKEIERIPNSLLFSSVPDRGLDNVAGIWSEVQKRNPNIHITITSDYRLWGTPDSRNNHFRMNWINHKNFTFLGAVNRARLIEEQLKADILFYPSTYDELFCISVAEAQVAGAYPITSGHGALETTNMGTTINTQEPLFYVEVLTEFLKDRAALEKVRREVMQEARERFAPENILKQWDEKVFT